MTTFTFYLPVPYESDNSVEWTDSYVWTQATCHPCERHTEIFFSSVCFMVSPFGIAVLVAQCIDFECVPVCSAHEIGFYKEVIMTMRY